MLMLGEKHRPLKASINLFSSLLGLGHRRPAVAVDANHGVPGSIGVYLPGNWQVPFGIVLVVDRLSALMLVLTGIIGVSALLFAMARWDRAGRQLPCAVPDPADGPVRRLPHRRPVQPVRVLRGAAGGVLWPDAARLGPGAGVVRACITSRSTCWPRRCS